MKGRKSKEYYLGERVYSVSKGKSGQGILYGLVYLPKELIGKKILIKELEKKEHKDIEIIKRTYTSKKKNRVERRLKR